MNTGPQGLIPPLRYMFQMPGIDRLLTLENKHSALSVGRCLHGGIHEIINVVRVVEGPRRSFMVLAILAGLN